MSEQCYVVMSDSWTSSEAHAVFDAEEDALRWIAAQPAAAGYYVVPLERNPLIPRAVPTFPEP